MTALRPRKGAFALIGSPVAQSVSPAMHRAAFRALRLDLDYVAIEVPSGALAAAFPELRRRFEGLNVTRPLKEKIVNLLDDISPEASAAGSVNTVVFDGPRAHGHSTDGAGFLAALARAGVAIPDAAVVLGTGGASRAVAAALVAAGASVRVWGRNAAAGHALAGALGVSFIGSDAGALAEAVERAGLVVNATPVGSSPRTDESPLPDGVRPRPGTAVLDLVYRPRRTRLLRDAAAAGCATVEGVEMLVEQGARSLELWTGRPAPVAVMREAALRALGALGALGALPALEREEV